MYFKEWCYHVFGITGFTEGKILNWTHFPAMPNTQPVISQLFIDGGGYVVDTKYLRGILILDDNYQNVLDHLEKFYSQHPHLNSHGFSQWLKDYFYKMGVNLSREVEFRKAAPIYINFERFENLQRFENAYRHFQPYKILNPLDGKENLELSPYFIDYLRQLYYQDPRAEIHYQPLILLLKSQLQRLEACKELIIKNALHDLLEKVHFLSKDYSNSKNKIDLFAEEAVSTYALSLKFYAELNSDNLTADEYMKLYEASTVLMAYDKNGTVQQSLNTDVEFIKCLKELYEPCYRAKSVVLRHLPKSVSSAIFSLIYQNIISILHGNVSAFLTKNKVFSAARFLPDDNMQSQTDQLVVMGGGVKGHFAIFRLIKVGIRKDGVPATLGEKPHFYEYYKVEDNLGDGLHGQNHQDKTCLGTYVTRLEPFALYNDSLIPITIDPYVCPKEYQKAMELTLTELLRAERHLLFYDAPETQPNSPSFDSDVGQEWVMLNRLKLKLSGTFYPHPITYYSEDFFYPNQRVKRIVYNQLNFYQEGGSCLIFSLKSLVGSLIGSELTALHDNFLQLNDSQQYVEKMDQKIVYLRQKIQELSTYFPSPQNRSGFFSSKQAPINQGENAQENRCSC